MIAGGRPESAGFFSLLGIHATSLIQQDDISNLKTGRAMGGWGLDGCAGYDQLGGGLLQQEAVNHRISSTQGDGIRSENRCPGVAMVILGGGTQEQ